MAAVLVVGVGVFASLGGDAGRDGPTASPATDAPVATATTRATIRPTPRPIPTPTPVPTLSALPAPAGQAGMIPTSVLVADLGDPAIGELVADADGTVWGTRAGGVVNFDPTTGRAHEWTLADDPAFATSGLAPARHGGVWLVGPDAIRRFDGDRFRTVIEAPEPPWFMLEGEGGELWAQVDRYGLVRWADGVWRSDPEGRPGRDVLDLAVDADGRIWTSNVDLAEGWAGRGISVWDGSAWTNFDPDELSSLRGRSDPPELIASEGGSVWATQGSQAARYGPAGWTSFEAADVDPAVSLRAVGPDGRLWFARDGCESCAVEITVVDGPVVTTYGEEDGLPGADDVGDSGAEILAGSAYTLAATEIGLYRLAEGSWEALDLRTAAGAPVAGSVGLGGVPDIAAMSDREVWAVTSRDGSVEGAQHLFRFDGAGWHRVPLRADTLLGRIAVAPDGALWVATSSGPLVHRGRSWTDLGDMVRALVPDGDDVAGECGGVVSIGADGAVYYAGPGSGNRVVVLRSSGESWQADLHPAPALSESCYAAIATTSDGTAWILEPGWGYTLWRSTGGPWAEVNPPDTDQPGWVELAAIATDQDGSLWAVTVRGSEPDETPHIHLVERVDEEWVLRRVWNGGWVGALAVLPEGDLIAVGDGILRLDELGSTWSLRGAWFDAVSVAPDGAVWVAGPNVYRLPTWEPNAISPPVE